MGWHDSKRKPQTGIHVYFLLAKRCNRIKIGSSANPQRRMNELGTSCPDDLELLGTMSADIATEPAIHRKFKRFRVQGEWFESDPSILDFIKINCINSDNKVVNIKKSMSCRDVRREDKQKKATLIARQILKEREYESIATRMIQHLYSGANDEYQQTKAAMQSIGDDLISLAHLTGRNIRGFECRGLQKRFREERRQKEEATFLAQYQQENAA
jgi:hypothetical protein